VVRFGHHAPGCYHGCRHSNMKTPGLTRNNCKTILDSDFILLFSIFLYGVELDFTYDLFIIYRAPLYSLLNKQLFFIYLITTI